jgi:biopolymer transport protein ExbD
MSLGKSLLRFEFVLGVVVGAGLASLGAVAVMLSRSDVVRPEAAVMEVPTGGPAVMTLSREGTIFLGSKEVSRAELVPELRAAFSRSGSHHLMVYVDHALPGDEAMRVLAVTKRAGAFVTTVSIN